MGLWWIGAAFLVEAERHAVLLPIAVAGLPLLLSLFTGAAAVLAALAPPALAYRAIALAVAIGFTEWARGVVLTGFPWNAAGVGLTQSDLLAQSVAVVGIAGLSPVAVFFGCLPAALARAQSRWLAIPAGVLLAAMTAYGAHRLLTAPSAPAEPPLALRLVQPAVPQDQKWDPAYQAQIWQRLLSLTRAGEAPVDVVIWPETAIPFLYRPQGRVLTDIAEALAPDRILLTGAAEVEPGPDGPLTYNTVLAIGPDGMPAARYDKVHLVPFGEYVPFAPLLERIGLSALAAAGGAFASGDGPRAITVTGLPPFQPLICYEVVFSNVLPQDDVAFILNVTNDAWFGDTPGPRQHLRHARLQAIERGRPVVRVANTGISAVFDTAGRAVARLPLNVQGAIDANLPAPRAALYPVIGDRPLYVLWIVAALGFLALRAKKRRRGSVVHPT